MSLSCICNEWDGEGIIYWPDDNLRPLIDGKYRKTCQSCGRKLSRGDQVLEFKRGRGARDDIEEKIYDDGGVPLSPVYHCENCGEIYLNLEALGYCIDYTENMPEALAQYRREHNSGGWYKREK